MADRSVEDRLREEYFQLLPETRLVADYLETEVKHQLLPIVRRLAKYEQVTVKCRIKECDSALGALLRRQEGRTFDQEQPDRYSLADLNDLAGVRILVFPHDRLAEVNDHLRDQWSEWIADPVPTVADESGPLAFKYHGICEASETVRGEIQVVSMLVGLFWEVEHSVVYKPDQRLKDIGRDPEMSESLHDVYRSFHGFENSLRNLLSQI